MRGRKSVQKRQKNADFYGLEFQKTVSGMKKFKTRKIFTARRAAKSSSGRNPSFLYILQALSTAVISSSGSSTLTSSVALFLIF